MLVMAKRKKVSGEHKAARKPVQLPADWLEVAKRLAQERPMPMNWLLVELIKREAESRGKTDLPPLPWSS